MDRSQVIDEAQKANKRSEEELNKQNREKLERRELEKAYLKKVLNTQMEGKRSKGEKRVEVLSHLLHMNKLPYKISHVGKSDVIKDNI
jgi:hypothetical protein